MKTVLLSILLCIYSFTYSQIRLPKLISDGMILQRDVSTKLWGWAAPDERVTLEFNKKEFNTIADKDGRWTIQLPSQPAGGPHQMIFFASNKIILTNILFGDVWVCSGQSNMELGMDRVKDKYADIVATVNNPEIRQFLVPDKYDFEKPREDVESGQWLEAKPENILKFSAVAYFFASDLYQKYKIPIGLINAALGGSPAQSWMSEEALKKFPDYYNELQRFKSRDLISKIESHDKKANDAWYSLLNKTDNGLKNHWSQARLDDSDWPQMNIPGYWADADAGNVNGAVWFRNEVEVPAKMIGKPAKLLMGRIVDADSVFVNGSFVGTTSYLYPPRRYEIQPKVLKEGKNSIAVRVINSSGKGGFVLDKPYYLIAGDDSINLSGSWKYKVGTKMDTLTRSTVIRWKPGGLYNAMIHPLLNYSVKGTIWYQGESNTKKPSEYLALMTTLIADWRVHWHQRNMPFLFVQLTNFMDTHTTPSESSWAELRMAQLKILDVQNTGMAVSIDLGEWNDIHPLNKRDVGSRLALQAMRVAYGDKKVIASGPLFKSIERRGNKLILSFSNTGNGLISRGGNPLNYFSIAGADKKFVWAKAEIKGEQVIVWNEAIPDPSFVRYAWADNPQGANLYNQEHLPASPFEATLQNPSITTPRN